MDELVKNILSLGALVGIFTGIVTKYFKENAKQQKEFLIGQSETNNLLEKLNTTMEHEFILIKRDVNNNFGIIDDNFGIVNGELVELKKVVFEKDKGNKLPLRYIDKL